MHVFFFEGHLFDRRAYLGYDDVVGKAPPTEHPIGKSLRISYEYRNTEVILLISLPVWDEPVRGLYSIDIIVGEDVTRRRELRQVAVVDVFVEHESGITSAFEYLETLVRSYFLDASNEAATVFGMSENPFR